MRGNRLQPVIIRVVNLKTRAEVYQDGILYGTCGTHELAQEVAQDLKRGLNHEGLEARIYTKPYASRK